MDPATEHWDAIVVGAGLAGLCCAFELAERGRRVLVLEDRAVVGGRTSSWNESGMPVESGLHRFLGFYKALPRLLRRAGIPLGPLLAWEDAIEIRLPDGAPSALFPLSPLHRPFSTIRGLLGNNAFLPPLDKLRLIAFLLAGFADYLARPGFLDRLSVAEYAERRRLDARLLQRMLIPLSAGLFFLPVERYSAFVFFGLLAQPLPRLLSMRIGAFRGGMTEVMAAPLARAIEARGGHVETSSPVERLHLEGGAVRGVRLAKRRICAAHVVLAVPLSAAQKLLRHDFARHPWFAPMLHLPSMPYVTLQLEARRPTMPVDRTTFAPTTCLAVFTEQSRTTFPAAAGRFSAILAPPDEFLMLDPPKVLDRVARDASRLGIDLRSPLVDYRVVGLREDFHSLAPWNQDLRPDQRTPIPGLVLAGDWTRQPLHATMEGATISGILAADVLAGRG